MIIMLYYISSVHNRTHTLMRAVALITYRKGLSDNRVRIKLVLFVQKKKKGVFSVLYPRLKYFSLTINTDVTSVLFNSIVVVVFFFFFINLIIYGRRKHTSDTPMTLDVSRMALTFRETIQDEVLVLCGMRLRKHHKKIAATQRRRRWMLLLLLLLLSSCSLHLHVTAGVRRCALFDICRCSALPFTTSSSSSSTLPSGVRGTHCCNKSLKWFSATESGVY